MEPGSIVRMGGMSDCFQPIELLERVTLKTIRALNERRVRYLIVTKSHLVAEKEYLEAMNPELAHIQITVTSLDDDKAMGYEMSSPSSMRVAAYWTLREQGFDVALRLSPLIEESMNFDVLHNMDISKCVVEFLRVNTWIRRWFPNVDYSRYTLHQSGYHHLPLDEKLRLLAQISIPELTVCEDVTEHYLYWRMNKNPNPDDCCNLRTSGCLPGKW